jgi:hypothetical protein
VEVELGKLNWFVSKVRFLATRKARLSTVVDALTTIAAGEPLPHKVITTRYTTGLPLVDAESRDQLLQFVRSFMLPGEQAHQ